MSVMGLCTSPPGPRSCSSPLPPLPFPARTTRVENADMVSPTPMMCHMAKFARRFPRFFELERSPLSPESRCGGIRIRPPRGRVRPCGPRLGSYSIHRPVEDPRGRCDRELDEDDCCKFLLDVIIGVCCCCFVRRMNVWSSL